MPRLTVSVVELWGKDGDNDPISISFQISQSLLGREKAHLV